MADFDVTQADVQNAKIFLRSFLAAKIPNGDYTEGGVVDDLVVGAHGYIIAYLLKQIRIIKDRQSTRTLKNLPEDESVSDATDAILDNFFLSRDQGAFSRGPATVHLTQRVDSLIPRTSRFFKTSTLVYYPDSDVDVFVPASSLQPNIDASGVLVDYTFKLNLVAARVGSQYDIDPGRFVTADRFSPYLSYIENLAKFAFGLGVQSTREFIAASENAISLRALINERSNDVTLRDVFPGIKEVLSIGYGDPEMTRDLIKETASGVKLHIGGHTDIYTRIPTQEVTENFTINELTPRADGLAVILRDSAPPSGSFVDSGVVAGDVLVIAAGIPEAPAQYVISKVTDNEITVSERIPFSVSTDAVTSPPAMSYTIGNNYPAFDNKVTQLDVTSARTSNQFKVFNGAILPGGPLYRVKKVQIIDAPSQFDPYRDSVTGTLLFRNRLNQPPVGTPRPGDQLGYAVVCQNPEASLSNASIQYLVVGWPAADLTGLVLEVTYDTLAGYDTVAAYVGDARNRILAANTLVRGQHPVYLSFSIPYKRSKSASNTTVFDPVTAVNGLVSFINNYQSDDVLDQSLLATQARGPLGAIYPFSVSYDLLAADGKVYHFVTEDTVTVFPDGTSSSARLLNPEDFGLPTTGYYAALKRQLLLSGVSDRTIRYLTSSDEISFFTKG